MKKDNFYGEGLPNWYDGKCDTCPFWKVKDNRCICTENEQDVTWYTVHDRVNENCPYKTK